MHPDFYKRPLLLALIVLILGLLFFYKPVPNEQDVSTFISQQEVTLVGQVSHFYTVKPKSNNVIVKVLSVNGKPATGRVYARLTGFEPLWKDTLQITGRLQEPYGIDLLGNFNWKKYLAYKGVWAEIKSNQVQVVKPALWPYRALRAVRSDILQTFTEHFEPELASIASGILLGERGNLSSQLVAAFQDSGAIHLLVASGGNVGFVTLIILAICAWVGLSRPKALAIALLVAGIYTLIAGADAPLMRAYFMAVCACCGYYLGRNSGVLQGLVISCLVILIIYPSSLFETGFEMSFLATAALIIALANYPIPAKWPRWVRFFAQIFLVTLAVQLVLLPVFTNVFYKVSLTGLVANMLLVPLASILLGLSFIYYIFTLCHVGIVLYYPTTFLLNIFKCLVEFFASLPFSAIPVAAWSAWTVAAYYIGLFGVLHAPIKKWKRALLIIIPSLIVMCIMMHFWQRNNTRVYLLDEWYKNVAIVEIKRGPVLIVGSSLEPQKIKNALYKLGHRRADAVLLTDKRSSKFDYSSFCAKTIIPFESMWPTDKMEMPHKVTISMQWGLHETKKGRIWYNTGYSGSDKDDVSYCFAVSTDLPFCVASGARFLLSPGFRVKPIVNQTVKIKL